MSRRQGSDPVILPLAAAPKNFFCAILAGVTRIAIFLSPATTLAHPPRRGINPDGGGRLKRVLDGRIQYVRNQEHSGCSKDQKCIDLHRQNDTSEILRTGLTATDNTPKLFYVRNATSGLIRT